MLCFLVLFMSISVLYVCGLAGFGQKKVNSPSSTSANNVDQCPCGSELLYNNCCELLHNGDCLHVSPEQITRARYSAFAKGNPGFLIDTAHPNHKDYVRFNAGNIDPRKARKAWEKEIVTKNTEIYEFLRLKIVNNSIIEESGECKVCFQVLVRKKSDGTYIPFQETSVYVPTSTVDIVTRVMTPKGSPILKQLSWLYSHAVVTEIEPEQARRLVEEAPRYVSGASIRDRWEGKSSREIL